MKFSKLSILVLALLLLLSTISNAACLGSLIYWNANYTGDSQGIEKIGKYSYTPSVSVSNLASAFTALTTSYIPHARNQWSGAGISTNSVTSNADIRVVGGTLSQLQSLYPQFSSSWTGVTLMVRTATGDYYLYQGTNYKYLYSIGTNQPMYIRYFDPAVETPRTDSQYRKTCTHELGHALGWYGHSTSNADIMFYAGSSVTSLTSNDINHLEQIY